MRLLGWAGCAVHSLFKTPLGHSTSAILVIRMCDVAVWTLLSGNAADWGLSRNSSFTESELAIFGRLSSSFLSNPVVAMYELAALRHLPLSALEPSYCIEF